MRRLTRITGIILSLTALLAAGMTVALACPAQLGANPRSGPGGSRIKVDGSSFEAGRSVDVRWNSVSGPLLGTGTGPDFVIPVTIPDGASVASYTIYGIQTTADGSTQVTSVPFQVVAAGATAPSNQPASAPAPAPAAAAAAAPVPAPVRAAAPAPAFAPAAQPIRQPIAALTPALVPVVAADPGTAQAAKPSAEPAPAGGSADGNGASLWAAPRRAHATVASPPRSPQLTFVVPSAPTPIALGVALAALVLAAATLVSRQRRPAPQLILA